MGGACSSRPHGASGSGGAMPQNRIGGDAIGSPRRPTFSRLPSSMSLKRANTTTEMMAERHEKIKAKGKKSAQPKPIAAPPAVSTGDDGAVHRPLLHGPISGASSCGTASTASSASGTPLSSDLPEPGLLASCMPATMYQGPMGTELTSLYDMTRCLGKGLDSIVFEAIPRKEDLTQVGAFQVASRDRVAMKVLQKRRLFERKNRKLERLKLELGIWQKMQHPSVIQLLQVLESDEAVFIACEIANEELFDRLEAIEKFSEADARLVSAQIVSAVAHLHITHSVAHRDIKSANILCAHDHPTEPGCIKLADFGFTARFTDPRAAEFKDNCGTLEYYAPELCENMLARLRNERTIPYSAAVDCWALGCVIYECLAGQPPFWSDDDVDQVHLILRNRLEFPVDTFEQVSEEAKDVIRGLLQPDAELRLTIAEVVRAPWFVNTKSDDETADSSSSPAPGNEAMKLLFPDLPRPNIQKAKTRRKSLDYRKKFSHAYDPDEAQRAGLLASEDLSDKELLDRIARSDSDRKHRRKGSVTSLDMEGGADFHQLIRSGPNAEHWKGPVSISVEESMRRSQSEGKQWQGPFARRGSVQMKQEVEDALKQLENTSS